MVECCRLFRLQNYRQKMKTLGKTFNKKVFTPRHRPAALSSSTLNENESSSESSMPTLDGPTTAAQATVFDAPKTTEMPALCSESFAASYDSASDQAALDSSMEFDTSLDDSSYLSMLQEPAPAATMAATVKVRCEIVMILHQFRDTKIN